MIISVIFLVQVPNTMTMVGQVAGGCCYGVSKLDPKVRDTAIGLFGTDMDICSPIATLFISSTILLNISTSTRVVNSSYQVPGTIESTHLERLELFPFICWIIRKFEKL